MADVSTKDLADYGAYLTSQGHNPNDVAAYTQYLAAHHTAQESSWADTQLSPAPAMTGSITPRGIAGGIADSLPTVGMGLGAVGGTILGGGPETPVGIAGGVAGAAAGKAGGESAKSALNSLIGSSEAPKSSTEFYNNIAQAVKTGAEAQMIGGVVGAATKSFAASGLQKITGTNAEDITTYANKAAQINDMAKAANGNAAVAANKMREGFNADIDVARSQMNSKISSALRDSDARISGSQIIDALTKSRDAIDADLYPEQIKQVDALIDKVRSKFDENGQIFASDAHGLKQYLQKQASDAYRNPGQSMLGDQAANAAKAGAAVTRGLVNKAVPDVAAANDVLAGFHELEDTLNKNLHTEGQNYASLIAAGRGDSSAGLTNAENLKALGKLTGTDLLGEAKKLSAMDTFMGPKAGNPGRGGIPLALAAGGTAEALGGPAAAGPAAAGGYYLGGAMTSPKAVKGAMDIAMPVANTLGQVPGAPAALGQSIMHGASAVNALRKPGQ